MKRTRKEIEEANLALSLMFPKLSTDLQYRFRDAINTISAAIDEIELEEEVIENNITPKQKAEEILSRYLKVKTHKMFNGWWHKMTAKQCALIAVDEIVYEMYNAYKIVSYKYWNDVKDEINKL